VVKIAASAIIPQDQADDQRMVDSATAHKKGGALSRTALLSLDM
jgi:hypothetical protein